MTDKEPVCQRIVHAAKERFSHYGYCKTTMSEIARDCDMSPGNIYRFFEGKLDIAERIAQAMGDAQLDEVREIVRDPGRSAVNRLKDLLFFDLRSTFKSLDKDPKVFEIAQIISRERPDFANRQLAKERSLISEILSAGNASGELDVDDVLFAAEMIQSATMKFKYPQLYSYLTLDKLERELEGVFGLLVHGLAGQTLSSSR